MRLTVKPQILPANARLNKASNSGGVGVNKSVCFSHGLNGRFF